MKNNKINTNYIIRDWKIIVLIFAVGLLLLSFFAWQIYLSDQIGGGYFISDSEVVNTTIKTVDNKKLQADISIMEEKKVEFLKLKDSHSKLPDPAL